MKKLIMCCVLFFGILPVWKNNSLSVFNISTTQAQVSQATLLQWLLQQYPPSGGFTVQNATGSNCGCEVTVYWGNGTWTNFNPIAMSTFGNSSYSSGYMSYQSSQNSNNDPYNAGSSNSNSNNNPPVNNQQEWAALDNLFLSLQAQREWENQQEVNLFFNEFAFGYENTGSGPSCYYAAYDEYTEYSYSEAYTRSSAASPGTAVPGAGLPCANRFLLGGKIISFNPAQQSGITGFNFAGSAISGIQKAGGSYATSIKYDVTTASTYVNSTVACSGGPGSSSTGTYGNTKNDKIFHHPRPFIKFVNFDSLNSLSATALPPGIIRIAGTVLNTNEDIIGYENIPQNLIGISIGIDTANIKTARVDSQVVGRKREANGTYSYYCITLLAEDINTGNNSKKYIPEQINLHLQHAINLPAWLSDFFDKLFPDIIIGQCTIDYVNGKLDSLHKKTSYTILPSENLKRLAEFKSIAYDLLFGYFYCATNESAAKDGSCAGQVSMGILHELIATVDIDQMAEGLIKMVQGLGSQVQQTVQNAISSAQDAAKNETDSGTYVYDRFIKYFLKKSTQQVDSLYQKASSVANNFKKMYFTDCDSTVVDGSIHDMCCYRGGQLTMMALPIVFTLGDYAVVKLTNLAARYGLRAAQAAEMLADAERLGANIVQDGNKLLIKESEDVGADIISTQQRVGDDVVIAGEQDLKAVIKDGDLIDEIKPATPPINNVITETPGNKANKWNRKLNKALEPNKTYKVGNHTYKTDAQGRVKEVTCSNLQKIANDRNTYQQTVKCKKVKDGITDDQGGHLIGSQFEGAGEQINLVPMKKTINQPPGSYAAMEQDWANALNGGGTVTNVRIEIIYGANNRPVQLNVYCKVNGTDKFYPHIN